MSKIIERITEAIVATERAWFTAEEEPAFSLQKTIAIVALATMRRELYESGNSCCELMADELGKALKEAS